MENQKKMQFYGGTFGACLPLLVFMALMITIAALQKVSLVLFCMAGFAGLCTAFLLAKDKKEFEKAVVAGLKNDTLCVIIFAFLLAGVLSQELRQSGLIQGLTWLVTELGPNGLGRAGDVFLGISTSGNSKNVLYAAVAAKSKGLKVVGLTGEKENRLMEFTDVCIRVPETETYKIQELHLPVYHCLCLMLEEKFFG